MKKKLFIIPMMIAVLGGCSINVGITDESHDKGTSHKEISFEYFEGDTIDESLYTKAVINMPKYKTPADFHGHKETVDGQEVMVTPATEVVNYLGEQPDILESVINPQDVGNTELGLKIGNLITYINGGITFSFKKNIAAVRISAQPRSAISYEMDQVKEEIDQETAISVNGSKYIMLNSDFDSIENIVDTECNYVLPEASKTVTLAVGKFRAIISSITVYTLNS